MFKQIFLIECKKYALRRQMCLLAVTKYKDSPGAVNSRNPKYFSNDSKSDAVGVHLEAGRPQYVCSIVGALYIAPAYKLR